MRQQRKNVISHQHNGLTIRQDKYILNGVELRVRLVRSKDAFCLMDPINRAYLHIEEASLLIWRAKISPGVLLAQAKALFQGTVKYPRTRVEVKTLTIHSGVESETPDNVILGHLPKRIIIGFVKNDAFNGHRSKNPFNFRHFNINHFSLYVDSMKIPLKPMQPDFSKGNRYIDSYHTLFSGTGIHFINEGNDIYRLDYANGYCLFSFDLPPDLSAKCQSHWNLVKHGSLRIKHRVEGTLQQTINCIIYAEYDNVLEIDASRQVIVYYSC
ncbi:uncharacterized protein F54H12.2-like [Belonocnema kinseyi]|uniref:uncharacterized protein F54H12.2-like n=1 Tax=Belonocnema kinseyi TaxID=2817044 RepID=UPI00143D8F03|nr:uncharacterized protein F54H12.2-like [Belonocnema kinseyi]